MCVDDTLSGEKQYRGTFDRCRSIDPEFADVARDNFRLREHSPCIDSGTADTATLALAAVDLDSNVRIISGRVDIGCFEYAPSTGTGYRKLTYRTRNGTSATASTTVLTGSRRAEAGTVLFNLQGRAVKTDAVCRMQTPGAYINMRADGRRPHCDESPARAR